MSATLDQTAVAAHDLLFREVHVPVFLEKLAADYGVTPSNDDEVLQLLELAGKLRVAHETTTTKTANQRQNFLGKAIEKLDGIMAESGMAHRSAADARHTKLAQDLAASPEIRKAVLDYQNGIAASLQQQAAQK